MYKNFNGKKPELIKPEETILQWKPAEILTEPEKTIAKHKMKNKVNEKG